MKLKEIVEGFKWGARTSLDPTHNTRHDQMIKCHFQKGRNSPPTLTEYTVRGITTATIWTGEILLLYYVSKYFLERL